MAIRIEDEYTYSNPADANYPGGSFKNDSTGSTGDGTPLDDKWANDFLGFFQALLSKANIVPSGAPDTAETSQYFDAIESIMWQPGDTKFCMYATPGRRWLEMNGNTVGNAASAASARANADTFGLFTALWYLSPSAVPMYESSGTLVIARGASAAADFAANRKIAIPDMRGVGPRGWDHGRGFDPGRAIGSYQPDSLKSHAHSIDFTGHTSGGTDGGGRIGSGSNAPEGIDAFNTQTTGDLETVGKNVAGMFVIRF